VSLLYVDASALVKLVIREPETPALTAFLGPSDTPVTSRLAAVEVSRALLRRGPFEPRRLRAVLARVTFRELDEEVARLAARLEPVTLRTLDAVHLASAMDLGDDLAAFVCYDERLAEAARFHSMEVAAPA
jgi:predicted nucleic acid-binding protein